MERAGWVMGGAVGIGFFLIARSFLPSSLTNDLFFIGLGAMGLVVLGWLIPMPLRR